MKVSRVLIALVFLGAAALLYYPSLQWLTAYGRHSKTLAAIGLAAVIIAAALGVWAMRDQTSGGGDEE